jgi:uncharacterized protein (DUF305 family)
MPIAEPRAARRASSVNAPGVRARYIAAPRTEAARAPLGLMRVTADLLKLRSAIVLIGFGALPLLCGWLAAAPPHALANLASRCADVGTPAAGPAPHAIPGNDQFAPTSDLAIIDSMLRQHARAMTLANEALQHAQDSQVRRMALRIAEGHAGEMQFLRTWRATWFPDAPSADLSNAASDEYESLGSQCIGGEFDRAFLALLQAELQSEVTEARSALTSATHAELREFASLLIEVSTGEIRTIETLLAAP